MLNNLITFAMRLSAFEGITRQSIISGTSSTGTTELKNTRCALKQSRVSFFNLTIPSPYRWLVKHLAQLQETLVGSDKCPYWAEKGFPGRTFSFSFLLGVFFSLSFKNRFNPLRNNIQRDSGKHVSSVRYKGRASKLTTLYFTCLSIYQPLRTL